MLPFVSRHMKDNVELVHYHIKSRGVQSSVLVQIAFEKCTLNFYFENSEVGIKTIMANLQPLLALSFFFGLHIFMQPLLSRILDVFT